MRTSALLRPVAVLVAALLLAGCSGKDPGANAALDPTPGSDPLADPNATANVTFAPPEPDFFPSPTPGLSGHPVSFDASKSTDPEGGNLAYAWDFGDGATGEGVETQHAYAAPGAYTVVLTVTSDKSQMSAPASLTITVIDAAAVAPYFVLDDASGDGAPAHTDLLRVAVRQSTDDLALIFTLSDVTPQFAVASPVLLEFALNGAEYEVYGQGGSGHVYDYARDAEVEGARVAIDETANTVGVLLPLSQLTVRAPYEMVFETRIGEPQALHGQHVTDRAPDEGTARYQPRA